jgi:alcohol dehydrogenase (cytochrome c)
MKITAVVATLALLGGGALAQTLDELRHDGSNPDNVLTYGMGYSLQRYSPLRQIDRMTVKRLVPVWSLSLDNPWGEQAQPLVYNGVMYVTDAKASVAIDVATGRQIWKTPVDWLPETPRVVCCGVSSKGAAIFNGKVFRTTLDSYVVALDQKTGKEIWKQKAAEWMDGTSMTVAPLIAGGVLITGISGAEFGIRGFIDGWDPDTGKHLWRLRRAASPATRPGRRTPTPGSTAAARPGSPAPTIPISISPTGGPAIRRPGPRRPGQATTSMPPRCWRCGPRPARSSGTTSSRRATNTTMTPCGS